ncbi:MAG: serine/threonine protein kinase [Deltaproteobacteria bacterium]|nr:serine/threonine protein kinase [Deltaproteobacteria bacterium]
MCALARRDTLPGKLLLDRFLLGGKIGAGAVSDVYLARQRSVGNRNVAVKVVKRLLCESDTPEARIHRQRFQFEAELLAMVKSSCFASLVDCGTMVDEGVERPFMIMEHLDGTALSEYVKAGRRFTIGGAARIVLLLAEAMLDLHRFKVVYRDLSPNNVILEEGGPFGLVPRLFDLSHAIVPGVGGMDDSGGAGSLLAGTPPYAAPELRSAAGDERSDQFSLAAIFYAMLTSLPPIVLRSQTWEDYGAAVAGRRVLPEKPLKKYLPRVPRGLDAVVATALDVRPERRYPTVQEFIQDLCEVLLKSSLAKGTEGGDGFLSGLIARITLRG